MQTRAKILLLSISHFPSAVPVKGVSQTMGERGKRAHCQFGYWVFMSPVLATQSKMNIWTANTNYVEQGKCIPFVMQGA